LKKNKILLLNSFFDSESKIRNIKNNINIQNNNQKNKKIFKNTETNRDFSNFLKKDVILIIILIMKKDVLKIKYYKIKLKIIKQ
jgi:hypothetical protein